MSAAAPPRPLRACPSGRLRGDITVPGDKSISHRALMLGGLAMGRTTVTGLLEGEDVLATANAMRAFGATVTRQDDGSWVIDGVGVGGLREPDRVIDMGNAGTGIRLLAGLAATHPITSFFTGDASLCKRPMGRVADPLSGFGARFVLRQRGRPPMAVIGTAEPMPISYTLPMASAQVKSAVLLAGLNTPGVTEVIEPTPTRDHTERMLTHFGAVLEIDRRSEGRVIRLTGQPELIGSPVAVPADPSSAAFPVVAALLDPDSELVVRGVCMNPARTGLFDTLIEMGADLRIENRRDAAGEPVADLHVTGRATLRGIEVPAARAPSMIDEYPILSVAAAVAQGETRMCGLSELRVKESDRLAAVADGLTVCGVPHRLEGDDLIVTGARGALPGGGTVKTLLDHRIAMTFLILGLATKAPVSVDDAGPVATSFPGFTELMGRLGARFEPV